MCFNKRELKGKRKDDVELLGVTLTFSSLLVLAQYNVKVPGALRA